MISAQDATITYFPYCGGTQGGSTRYVARVVEIGGIKPYAEKTNAIEMHCSPLNAKSCH